MRCAAILLCLTLATGCEVNSGERVLSDYGTQPELTVTRLRPGDTQDLGLVIASAKKGAASLSDDIWPEPVKIVEHEQSWDVWFAYREKIVERGGRKVVRTQTPAVVDIVVQKSDLTARVRPNR